MTSAPAAAPRRNPFATRHVRPGRLVPCDENGAPLDLDALVARAGAPRVATIEGPHGSGKTTLLVALANRLAAAGQLAGTIRTESRSAGAAVLAALLRAAPGTTLCVDGWETLGGAAAAVARWVARRRGVGLIATSHGPVRMPTLVRCGTTPALLARLVADLPDHGGLIGADDVTAAFMAHGGDIREALYDLYDRFERRSRSR